MNEKKQKAAALYNDVKAWLVGEFPSPVHLVTAPVIEEWQPVWINEAEGFVMKIEGMAADGERIRTSAVALLDRHFEWARTKNRVYRLGQQARHRYPAGGSVDVKVLSASVRDGRLVIVVEAPAEATYYDLAAAEDAIGAALGCEVDVVTNRMLRDPLGYDTSDPNYLRKMARDALTGKNEAAVDAEVAALKKTLGLTPKPPSRWRRIKRWLSHRRWRLYFWMKDKRW